MLESTALFSPLDRGLVSCLNDDFEKFSTSDLPIFNAVSLLLLWYEDVVDVCFSEFPKTDEYTRAAAEPRVILLYFVLLLSVVSLISLFLLLFAESFCLITLLLPNDVMPVVVAKVDAEGTAPGDPEDVSELLL